MSVDNHYVMEPVSIRQHERYVNKTGSREKVFSNFWIG
jgi:hypothetical protein